MSNDPRYPIGKYEPQAFSAAQKKAWLSDIQFLPEELEKPFSISMQNNCKHLIAMGDGLYNNWYIMWPIAT